MSEISVSVSGAPEIADIKSKCLSFAKAVAAFLAFYLPAGTSMEIDVSYSDARTLAKSLYGASLPPESAGNRVRYSLPLPTLSFLSDYSETEAAERSTLALLQTPSFEGALAAFLLFDEYRKGVLTAALRAARGVVQRYYTLTGKVPKEVAELAEDLEKSLRG